MLSLNSVVKLALVAATAISPVLAAPTTNLEAREFPNAWGGVVSTTWLSEHLSDADLIILDVRPAAQYAVAHIAGSVNVPSEYWWGDAGSNLSAQLFPPSKIRPRLEAVGISWPAQSRIVFVASPKNGNPGRIASGLRSVGFPKSSYAMLNAGYDRWVAKGGATTTVVPNPSPGKIVAQEDTSFLSVASDIEAAIGRRSEGVWIVDARAPEYYSGETVDPATNGQRGHIESAVSLPARFSDGNGGFPDAEVMRAAAEAVFEGTTPREIHVYCHIGQMGSIMYFILSHILGYENVHLYDGSTEDWSANHKLVLD